MIFFKKYKKFIIDRQTSDRLNMFSAQHVFREEFGVIPSLISESEITPPGFEYITDIDNVIRISGHYWLKKKNPTPYFEAALYLSKKMKCVFVIKNCWNKNYDISILYEHSYLIQPLLESISKYSPENKKESGILNIVSHDGQRYQLIQSEIKNNNINITDHYNDDFSEIDDLIKIKLNEDNSKGLVLLHGLPGTGKTSYIRHLISVGIKNKRIIYIPPHMTNILSNPDFIPFLIEKNNSILIIEDAENVLMKREGQSHQTISNILNFSDGLLSDVANIQILCTFNTNIANIDEALLRKGRLIAKYEFAALSETKTQSLCQKLGVSLCGPQTIGNIFGANEMSFNKKNRTPVGFSTHMS